MKGKTIVKRPVKASSEDFKDYEVTVNFATYVGADEIYSVFAKNEEDAQEDALQQAKDDLSVEDINETDDGEWEVEVGFAGMVGVSEIYTVYADDEDEAADTALEEAADDLGVTDIVLAD